MSLSSLPPILFLSTSTMHASYSTYRSHQHEFRTSVDSAEVVPGPVVPANAQHHTHIEYPVHSQTCLFQLTASCDVSVIPLCSLTGTLRCLVRDGPQQAANMGHGNGICSAAAAVAILRPCLWCKIHTAEAQSQCVAASNQCCSSGALPQLGCGCCYQIWRQQCLRYPSLAAQVRKQEIRQLYNSMKALSLPSCRRSHLCVA